MSSAKARPRTCDAPTCNEVVGRGLLMCRAHWFALPVELRSAIKSTWEARRMADWSANCLAAREFLAKRREPRVTPQHAYEAQRRMLGERDAGGEA